MEPCPSPPPPRPSRRRNSTRDRNVAELRALRLLAKELEARVLQLASPSSSSSLVSNVTRRASRPNCLLWKRVAERQRTATHTAQRENRALLDEVQRRTEWIERLWTLLRETRRIDSITDEARLNARAVDAAVFARLKGEGGTTASWKTALATFEANGVCLGGRGGSSDDRWTRAMDVDGGLCSLVVERHLPFDALATTQAIWAALSAVGNAATAAKRTPTTTTTAPGCGGTDGGCCFSSPNTVVLERSQTTCAMKYAINAALVLGDVKPTIRCHAVVQTVVAGGTSEGNTGGASLFAWHSINSASCYGATATGRDTMWVAVSTSAGDALGSTVSIVVDSQLDPSRNQIPFLLESLLRACEFCVADVLGQAENALVDASLGGHGPSPSLESSSEASIAV